MYKKSGDDITDLSSRGFNAKPILFTQIWNLKNF